MANGIEKLLRYQSMWKCFACGQKYYGSIIQVRVRGKLHKCKAVWRTW